jgi:hypothetical protein
MVLSSKMTSYVMPCRMAAVSTMGMPPCFALGWKGSLGEE